MSDELREGVAISAIWFWNDQPCGEPTTLSVGDETTSGRCESIRVAMQPGQMGMVPWALARFSSGPPVLFNLGLVQSVELAEDGSS